jgi:hypothetical protein
VDEFYNKLKPWSKEGAAVSRATKQTTSTENNSKQVDGNFGKMVQGDDLYLLLCGILVLLLAILLADKIGAIEL